MILIFFIESLGFKFGRGRGLITFNFQSDRRPETKGDLMALGFMTTNTSGLLIRIDGGNSNDYLELSIVK